MTNRRKKTPAERAQEAYDVEERRAKRLYDQKAKATAELNRITGEHDAAVARRNHLAQHPDLPKQNTTKSGDNPA